jgi:hypothetical protein
MYQSGWDAADTWAGLYGPHSQIGLICTTPASRAIAAKTTKNKPVDLAANVGNMRMPTTLCSVRPAPGNWVCFCLIMISRCRPISARSTPGISSTWTM